MISGGHLIATLYLIHTGSCDSPFSSEYRDMQLLLIPCLLPLLSFKCCLQLMQAIIYLLLNNSFALRNAW
ncbi:uncharacterized protein PHALS_14475 [Plasmopara halstedii]|uniref:Uncharacterized protein n=1 Tax=Plasmopara halstedii TaxID=4781 RepID=A0A0P1ARI9_PLAHL|nr:uncharacterized protein PHALS_14475 [Plasmopara halstedii]CEG44217.1 hypothetical protein PHALS_14475 [Plasmopara halstedii]|eukprot:XP_024580586.1 hypothetical protein PHALS_14475 [Plasmopara halstedii]